MGKVISKRAAAYAPLAAALLVLILAAASPALAPRGILPLAAEIPLWGLLGTLAALHRPLAGLATLGVGTIVLAASVERLGTIPAALLASFMLSLAERIRTAAGLSDPKGSPPSHQLPAGLPLQLAPVIGATLAAGAVLSLEAAPVDGWTLGAFAARAVGPIVAYGSSFVLIAWLVGLLTPRPASRLRPLGLDLAGWTIGLLLADAATVLGWTQTGILLAAIALLSAEAARNAVAERVSDHRAGKLERMQEAHARIFGESSAQETIARQIFTECRQVLPVQWFQIEMPSPGGPSPGTAAVAGAPATSWFAGPDGSLHEGRARPPERPRMLPGIHRRAAWRILERRLEVDDEILAMVRLWCDPRRIRPGAEELFETLIPHLASSVHRARLEREVHLDPLTGVPGRRALETRLQQAYRRACDQGEAIAVIMSDIDFFKRINDTYGHAAGDHALITVARTLDSERREGDFCCRYGGEEFTVLLFGADGARALQLAERLRRAVEALEVVFEDRQIPITLSAGVAAFPELHIKNAGELLLLADEALYEAKEQGRNRVLLNIGQGAYREASGALVGTAPAAGRELPRIFG